jgi:hypothetical protein
MGQHHDDFFENTQKATDKGALLNLPRLQKTLKYNFDWPHCYNTQTTHLDLPSRTLVLLGKWSPTSTTHYNYAQHFMTQMLRMMRRYIYNNVAYQRKGSRVNTGGSHVVHRLCKLKNDKMNLPDYYQFMKSTKYQTTVGYDVIVAEFVDKWL